MVKQHGSEKECLPGPNLEFEQQAWGKGFRNVAGVDEVGRGPLAGPVVVSAVILGKNWNPNIKLDDSKKLNEMVREECFHIINKKAVAVSTVSISASLVDRVNVLEASILGMIMAVERLSSDSDYVLVDGNRYPELDKPGEAVTRGDARCISIAAASIVAKVTRDRIMKGLQYLYPRWGFERHKGYPTLGHRKLLEKQNPSTIHRNSFISVRRHEKQKISPLC